MTGITLRPATIDDAAMLLEWRNDAVTRAASHSTGEIDIASHVAWLTVTLACTDRKLMVAEMDGKAVGTVRADAYEGHTELSWTVAPSARGKGISKLMVQTAVDQIGGVLLAEVKEGNAASVKVAQYCGFELARVNDGVMCFVRGGIRVARTG